MTSPACNGRINRPVDGEVRLADARHELAIESGAITRALARQLDDQPVSSHFIPDRVREAWLACRPAAVRGAVAVLTNPREPLSPESPETDNLVRSCAEAGVPLATLLRAVWIDQGVAWDAFVAKLETIVADPGARAELLEDCGPALRRWTDELDAYLAQRHLEYTGASQEAERERLDRVEQILIGARLDSASLGYDLERYHLAVIAWGESPGTAVAELGHTLERECFAVTPASDLTWAWLPSADGELTRAEQRALECFTPPAGTSLTTGDRLPGASGFRASHAQARQARRIAWLRPPRLTRYHEVALEAMASLDEEAARLFVLRELGMLYGDRRAIEPGGDRETLQAYFAAGQRSTGAAAILGVTDETVRNRLRRIEGRLGTSIVTRQAELLTALRLAAVVLPSH